MNLSNLDLINSYRETKDNSYLAELIEKNKPLIYKRMQDFKIRWSDFDDAFQGCLERLLSSIDSYDSKKSKFSTFVYMLTTSECIAFIGKSNRTGLVGIKDCWGESLKYNKSGYKPTFMEPSSDPEDVTSDLYWELDELKKVISTLPRHEQSLINRSYNQKMSFVEIGRELGITKQAVYQKILGIQNKLKKKLNNRI